MTTRRMMTMMSASHHWTRRRRRRRRRWRPKTGASTTKQTPAHRFSQSVTGSTVAMPTAKFLPSVTGCVCSSWAPCCGYCFQHGYHRASHAAGTYSQWYHFASEIFQCHSLAIASVLESVPTWYSLLVGCGAGGCSSSWAGGCSSSWGTCFVVAGFLVSRSSGQWPVVKRRLVKTS